MKKRLIVTGILFALSLALLFELGLLLYITGEPKEIHLGGSDIEFLIRLSEQMRLGHIVEMDGGELSFFYDGVLHQFHVLSVQERLGIALMNALRGDYGPAVSYEGAVGDTFGPAIAKSLLAYLGLFAGAGVTLFADKIKLSKTLRYVVLGVGCGLLVLSHILVGLVPSVFIVGIILLALSLGCFGLFLRQGKTLKQNLGWMFLLVAIGGVNLILFGLYQRQTNGILESLFFYGFFANDNHLYSVCSFYVFLIPVVIAFVGLTLRTLFSSPKKAENCEDIQQNISVK